MPQPDTAPADDSSFEVTTDVENEGTILTVAMTSPTGPSYVSVSIGIAHDPDVVDVEHATDAAATAILGIRKELR